MKPFDMMTAEQQQIIMSQCFSAYLDTDKNKANIDYIAMMTDVDIPTEV